MYDSRRRFQTPALDLTSSQTLETPSTVTITAPRRQTSMLRAIVRALAWVAEVRAMPFGGLEPGRQHDGRPKRNG